MRSRADGGESGASYVSELGVAILAAGAGSRLGGPKALFDLAGEALLLRILRTLEHAGDELQVLLHAVVVSGRDRDAVARALERWSSRVPTRLIANAEPERDRTHSLRLGVAELPGDAPFLVWPVDVPLVLPKTLQSLLRSPLEGNAFRIPCHAGRGGHPVLLGAALRELVLSLRDEETLRSLRDDPRVRCERLETGDAGVALDLDTLGDAERARSLLAERAAGRAS